MKMDKRSNPIGRRNIEEQPMMAKRPNPLGRLVIMTNSFSG